MYEHGSLLRLTSTPSEMKLPSVSPHGAMRVAWWTIVAFAAAQDPFTVLGVPGGSARWLLRCERSGKLDRARSRLYRSQVLQVNMRLKALAEIYTMHSFAQL